MRRGVIAALLASEPELAADVVFGIRASSFLADRFGDLLLSAGRRTAPRCYTRSPTHPRWAEPPDEHPPGGPPAPVPARPLPRGTSGTLVQTYGPTRRSCVPRPRPGAMRSNERHARPDLENRRAGG